MDVYQIKDLDDLSHLADTIWPHVENGGVILLDGDMGAGKTTFVSTLVCRMGYPDVQVSSPTYTVVNQYDTIPTIIHIDLYRVQSRQDIAHLDLDQYFNSKNMITIVEWALILENNIPDHAIQIQIQIGEGTHRSVSVEYL